MITTHPNCKINLGLSIVSRREDGYHNLQTVFYPVPLTDTLTLERADADSLQVDGMNVSGAIEDNLVWRAVNLLRAEGLPIPAISVKLTKRIPMGAGLGGGSSDAAFMIKMLNQEFQLHLSVQTMERLAVRLGADCPVFIQNKPVYAQGIGNEFESIAIDLRGWHLVLVKPADFVSTRQAYAAIHPAQPAFQLRHLGSLPVEQWRDVVVNDFEQSVFPQHPTIAAIRQHLYQLGAVYASMSGSGSSVYGLFSQPVRLHGEFEEHFLFTCQL